MRDAMTRWEESERSRLRLLTAFNEAEADVESGDFTDYTDENHSTLASQLKREARASREQP